MAFSDVYRFSMRPNMSQWFYWNGNVLGVSDTERYIEVPEEWKKTEAKWVRSFEQRGLKRAIAAPYQFVLDGAAIIRSVYYNGHVDEKIYFLIEKWNELTHEYEEHFGGELDLATNLNGALYNNGSISMSAAVIEGGVSGILTAEENTPYEIPLEGDADTISIDGITVQVNYSYGTTGTTVSGPHNMTVDPATIPALAFTDRGMNLTFAYKEGEYSAGTSDSESDIVMKHLAFAAASTEHNNHIYEATSTQDVTVTLHPNTFDYENGAYVGGNSGPVKMRISLVKWDSSAASASRVAFILDPTSCAVGNTKVFAVPLTEFTATLDAGDRLYVVYDVVVASTGLIPTVGSYGFEYDAKPEAVTVGVAFQLPATDCLAYPYRSVVGKLLDAITGSTAVLSSSFFSNASLITYDCLPYNVKLTSGDAIRRITTNPAGVAVTPTIRLTWAQLKKDMRCRFNLGIDIRGNTVVIEEAEHFFNPVQIIAELGEVRTMTVEPARDYFASNQKWGYTAQTFENLNGRDEPNTTQTWKWPQQRIQKEDDNICPFITSMYAITAMQANLAGKNTTDAATDNETFCIETESSTSGGKYDLYRPQTSASSQPTEMGLLFPLTAFNLTMSPKRNLLRSGKMIRSALYNMDSRALTFQTTDKNAEMHINCGMGAIQEKADIPVGTLDAPIFKPFIFHIEAVTPVAMKQSMDAKPTGCFSFTSQGITYKGFPVEVGIDGNLRNSYKMTLLCTADTDVTPLVTL